MTDWLRVVGAAIVFEGRVLAARRAEHKSLAGLWEFPGGKVDVGEREPAALRREINEELGIDIEVQRWLGTSFAVGATPAVELAVYRCVWPAFLKHADRLESTDHDQLVWCSAAELLVLPWAAADIPLVSQVRGALLTGR